jgi:hypothetical protein
MSRMTVVCPSCGEEREDEVSESEERQAIANVSWPEAHCKPCQKKADEERLLEESMHPEWGL